MLKKRTIILSAVMKWLVIAFALLLAAVAVYTILFPDAALDTLTREAASISAPGSITGAKRLLLILLTLPAFVIWLFLLHNLYRLFSAFERSQVFTTVTARAVRGAGFWLMVLMLVQIVVSALSSIVMTWDLGPGNRALQLSFTSQNFMMLVLGFVLCLMGIVMDEALRLSEENQQIV